MGGTGVTVVVRWVPGCTVRCGMRMARPARTTLASPDGDRSQLDRRVRPTHGVSPEGDPPLCLSEAQAKVCGRDDRDGSVGLLDGLLHLIDADAAGG